MTASPWRVATDTPGDCQAFCPYGNADARRG